MDIKTAFDGLDPEVIERITSRREILRSAMSKGAGWALASLPLTFATMAKSAFAQGGLPQQIVDVLNFALTLEYLEAEFYIMGVGTPGLIPAEFRDIYDQIRKHEVAHVQLLQSVLGAQAVAKPRFDFTAGGRFADVFSNYQTFALLAQAFEDTGVRAYKGQAPNLISNDAILTTALRIHSVEARHASEVRRIRGLQGWVPYEQPGVPAAAQAVYQGETNLTHGGVFLPAVVSALVGTEELTEAYDEPLSREQVLAIAGPFIRASTSFTVRVENVSQPGTLNTDRAMGTVPLSPGVYAVFTGANPMFTVGQPADEGTERIAEDGFPMMKAQMLSGMANVAQSGVFDSPGGPDNGPAIFAGESSSFTVNAVRGDRLQIETMFVQSNDWFYAFGGDGLALFDNAGRPISGDVTAQLVLYDAGTEEDTPPGTGPNQKPAQDPMATNVGPPDSVNRIQRASERHPGFAIPATSSVIRITITSQ